MIRQMKGEYAVRAANLIPLYERAKGLVRKVGKVTFGWVPREQNRMADFQSRLGLYGSVRQKAMDVLSNYIIEDTEGGVVFRSPKDTVWTVTKDEDGLYRCDCPAFARSRHMPCKHCGAAYYRSLACSG